MDGAKWIGLEWIGMEWIGLEWIGLQWIGLDEAKWIGRTRKKAETICFTSFFVFQCTSHLNPRAKRKPKRRLTGFCGSIILSLERRAFSQKENVLSFSFLREDFPTQPAERARNTTTFTEATATMPELPIR